MVEICDRRSAFGTTRGPNTRCLKIRMNEDLPIEDASRIRNRRPRRVSEKRSLFGGFGGDRCGFLGRDEGQLFHDGKAGLSQHLEDRCTVEARRVVLNTDCLPLVNLDAPNP